MTTEEKQRPSSWPWADRHPALAFLVCGAVLLTIVTVAVLVVVGVLTSGGGSGGCGFDLAGTCGSS